MFAAIFVFDSALTGNIDEILS